MASVFILSMLSDLYFNLKINELSSDLEQINNEISKSSIAAPKIGENTLPISEEFNLWK